jgi:hypothetical protein
VALKLVPESKTFIDLLKTEDEDCDTLKQKMQILVSLLVPFLEDIHCILVSFDFFSQIILSIGHEINSYILVLTLRIFCFAEIV